ncbi:MAG: lipopolysaccharide biosynthesis protein [Phenylobacterium sp.]|uniref:lipopolysaccharide biosynthesis protein n=1 Tax=Phenylobacterium sp. TaxID=1871053 RepID=UPI0012052121|nr:lipopolysaccharide biosynthesis protein [Phenylobacterium sp.]TAJ68837.1 MAG: lipopolysaccharide biosynthesis protein [Phenylobacterium sp.]
MPEACRGSVVGRIYGNLGRLLGGKAAAGVVSLVYIAIAARELGPAEYGVLVLVHTYVMTVGGLIEFPGWHAVVRYGAQALEAGDRPRVTRLLAFAGVVEMAAGVLAVAIAAILAPWVGQKLGWSPTAIAFALPYSLAVLASIRATPAGYLQLAGRFDLLGAHSVVAPLFRLAGAGIAVAAQAGLRGFLIAWLVAALAEWAAMWALGAWAARGKFTWRDLRSGLSGVPAENPGLWRFMWGANADVTLSEFAGRAAPLAVGWILGPAAAGLYAVAQRATVVISQPALVLGQAAYAELARLAAAGHRGARIRAALGPAIGIALLAAAPVCVLIGLFGPWVATTVAGPAFAGAAGIMLWLALARALQLAAPPLSATLTVLGRPGLSVRANLLSCVGLLALLPPLLAWLGLGGAAAFAILQAVAAVGLLAVAVHGETRGADLLVAETRA